MLLLAYLYYHSNLYGGEIMQRGLVASSTLFGVTGMMIASGIGGSFGGTVGALVGWSVASICGLLGG